MIRVVVVDDEALVRAGLAALIRAAPGLDVVGEASSGEEAVEAARATAPDVILMDISMPGMEVVGTAADGAEAVALARQEQPDVMVVDVQMPVLDGIEATRRIRTAPGAPRVLMLTTFDLDEYVYDALRAGASGFLL